MKAYRVAYRDHDDGYYKITENGEEYYDSEEKVLASHPDAKIQVYKPYITDKGKYRKELIAGEKVWRGWIYEEIEIK